MRFECVIDAIGHTPVVRLNLPHPRVDGYAKLELQNMFGMKDRVARQIVLRARESGELLPGAPFIESLSGTMALAVALVGTALGHPVHIVTDPRIDPITRAKLESFGCTVHVVQRMSAHGWQSARLERLELVRAEQQIFAGNTSGSVYRVLRHIAAQMRPGARLVGILPDRGDRYIDTVYNRGHWEEHRLREQVDRASPIRVEYGRPVSSWSYSYLSDVRDGAICRSA
jgi:cysteine synthase